MSHDTTLGQMQSRVIKVISKEKDLRSNQEIEFVLPWLRKKSDLLCNIEKEALIKIIRGCEYQQCERDEVIIQQGDRGDSFYVILSGSVSIYIDSLQSGEDEKKPVKKKASKNINAIPENPAQEGATIDEQPTAPPVSKRTKLDRSQFGKFIIVFPSGKSFGELALINEDCIRNASIITDERCHLLVIYRSLYNQTLKELQEREYADRKSFIDEHPLFKSWNPRFKRLLEMSLIKEVYSYDSDIIRQGQAMDGLKFLRRGRANVLIEPNRHPTMYPSMLPFKHMNDVYELELNRKSKRLVKPAGSDRVESVRQPHVLVKRKAGYVAAEKLQLQRSVLLCMVQDGEVIGDIETIMAMDKHMLTITCTTSCEVYSLTSKNFDRLVTRKNPGMLDLLNKFVITKLRNRVHSVQGEHIPLLKHILFKLTEELKPTPRKEIPPLRGTKDLPDRDVLFEHQMEVFAKDKAEMVEPYVPGAIYYREIMREKAQLRESIQKRKKLYEPIRRKRRNTRIVIARPRTLVAIKAALERQSEIAEERERKRVIKAIREQQRNNIMNEFKAQENELRNRITEQQQQEMEAAIVTEEKAQGNDEELSKEEDVEEEEFDETEYEVYTKTLTLPPIREVQESRERAINVRHKQKSPEEHIEATDTGFETTSEHNVGRSPLQDQTNHGSNGSEMKQNAFSPVKPLSNNHTQGSDGQSNKFKIPPRLRAYLEKEDDDPHYRDWETSDTTLGYLEERVYSFIKKNRPDRSKTNTKLAKLKRFQADEEELKQPKRGGKVIVNRRRCRHADSEYIITNHSHLNRNMVPQIPEYTERKNSRMLAQLSFDQKNVTPRESQDT